ncbi:MAG: hypothetical protein PHQ40_11765 [Anaerolineaceae bacterium]|nr:hypothetical protein [Anaerolineaceae bacterium]
MGLAGSGLETLGWIYQVLGVALPLTWGISLMRGVLYIPKLSYKTGYRPF